LSNGSMMLRVWLEIATFRSSKTKHRFRVRKPGPAHVPLFARRANPRLPYTCPRSPDSCAKSPLHA
jgi:hypothetical protein